MDMLCNETDIAELDIEVRRCSSWHCLLGCAISYVPPGLQMGSFQLHVRRRVDAAAAPTSQPSMGAAQNLAGIVPLIHVFGRESPLMTACPLYLSPLKSCYSTF